MKRQLLILTMIASGIAAVYAAPDYDYDDDIYYNPKKDKTAQTKGNSYGNRNGGSYIANFDSVDVDSYNRRGQYYLSPVDTIGSGMENGEDFLYTQQIQKYYNPTIVIDNASLLSDVLDNSYGNVNIVIDDNGYPSFGTYVNAWPYYSAPYYSSYWGPSWSWNWGYGGWGVSLGWSNPWYWDTWGPSWAWGPSWGWGPGYWNPGYWGPGYWGPSWSYNPNWDKHHYRPGGNHRVGANAGWTAGTRPGYNYNGNAGSHRGISSAPVNANRYPSSGYNYGNHRGGGISTRTTGFNGGSYRNGTIGTGGTRVNPATTGRGGNTRVGSSSGYNRGSSYNSGTNRGSGNNRSNGSTRSTYNSGSSRNSSGSYNSGNHRSGGSSYGGSYGGGRSGGGSFGGGRSGGGGGRSGGHR